MILKQLKVNTFRCYGITFFINVKTTFFRNLSNY